ncbi:hypothetical protein DXG01_009490 [Tephrocybe rancida]|nr:hypothetical protein DXG01_009490 [Tephrocybe rancida]
MSNTNEPWDDWTLDANFLMKLDDWAAENPENRLDRVLKCICDATDPVRELFEIIPDSTFPARGLVKGLAHLVKLGKTIAFANAEVHAFAVEIVEWVTLIQRAFSVGQKKFMKQSFTEIAWQNLQQIRDIIDEIFKWAAGRLSDKRWSLAATWRKLQTPVAIATFKTRIAEARELFKEREIIKQSRGIDAILDYLGIVSRGQKSIMKRLRDIKAAQEAQFNSVIARLDAADAKADAEDEERRKAAAAKERKESVERMLSKYAIEDPTHDAQEKLPCSEGTRVEVLAEITRWIEDTSPTSQNFLWLSGDPGCGKSAITASVVESSKAEKILWAEFFINRNNLNTTNPNVYFPTIAQQFAKRSKEVLDKLYYQLHADDLLTKMSSKQAARLFIDAIRGASNSNPAKPVVVVIDGLDETDRKYLNSTAIIFSQLFNDLSDCPNAKIFISSRTEDEIRNPFVRSISKSTLVRHLHLDTRASFRDVANYLRKELASIVVEDSLHWVDWPGDQGSEMLADYASGLFIWAVTAVRFFRQQIEDWGEESLSSLLDDLRLKGMMDINALYSYIVLETYKKQAKDERDSEWAFETFRRLVGAIVVIYEPLSVDNLRKILDLRRTSSTSPVDVVQFIKRLRTVLVAGTDAVHGHTVPRLHKSFFEYVTGAHIDRRFWVDTSASHRELSIRCFFQLSLAQSATTSFKMPTVFRYATRFWSQHLSEVLPGSSGIVVDDPNLDLRDLGLLFDRLLRTRAVAPIGLSVSGSSIRASVGGVTCAWDIGRGHVDGGISFRELQTKQLPEYTLNRNMKSQPSWRPSPAIVGVVPPNSICWLLPCDKVGLWDTETEDTVTLKTLKQASSPWTSSSGKTVVNGCFAEARDGTIRIWDISTHSRRANVTKSISFYEETGKWEQHISCLALSPSSETLAAGCDDGTLHCWNLTNGTHITTSPRLGPSSAIIAVVFSRDGDLALSCHQKESDIVMWILVGEEFHQTDQSFVFTCRNQQGVTEPHLIAFSPDSTTALSAHGDVICIWDVKSRELSGSPLTSPQEGAITFISFSKDAETIISGTKSGHLAIWDVETRQKLASFSASMVGTGITACPLVQSHRLCVASDSELKLLEIQGNHTARITQDVLPGAFALSLDGSHVATLSPHGTIISLRDAVTGEPITESSEVDVALTNSVFFAFNNVFVAVQEGTSSLWEARDRKLIRARSPPAAAILPPLLLDLNDYNLGSITTFNDARWVPSQNPESSLWAFIGEHVIRGHKDGSLVVL